MAKHVYLSRRSVVLGITCRKMAEGATSLGRNEKRRDRAKDRRTDTFCMEYLRTKYPDIYSESMGFHKELEEIYPKKHDLRKPTSKPVISDNLRLDIPLWDTATLRSAQSLETIVEEVMAEGEIYPLQTEISNDLIETIMADLREDPYLTDLFKAVEADFELGAEITIDEDNRLENELT